MKLKLAYLFKCFFLIIKFDINSTYMTILILCNVNVG